MPHDPFGTLEVFGSPLGKGHIYSLERLEASGFRDVSTLPVSLRIVLESVLRHADGARIREEDVAALASWQPNAPRAEEVPFVVGRVLLQDFTGVPLLVDLAAMRAAVERAGRDPGAIEPLVPVDLVVDHSVQVDFWGGPDAFLRNLQKEFERNLERYEFLKWGTQAFEKLRVVPPGIGICHQVNLEVLAAGVLASDGVYYPDTLVGTDSHTTMVNALGVAGWGVGGIEAEAAMLGQPVSFLMPDVVGVALRGRLRPGVTATDLVLRLTELLRSANVVGKFVEYHGDGAAALSVPDRATIANMAPEYGATMGFFPPDEATCEYLAATGRSPEQVETVRAYFQRQGLFGMPRKGKLRYSSVIELDLSSVRPSVAGPRRPQDRVELAELKRKFQELLVRPAAEGGYGRPPEAVSQAHAVRLEGGESHASTAEVRDGSVVLAAITSCTNTSNPAVMLAAGVLARKAVERGLAAAPGVKTSLAPGSRVVTEYLLRSGLLPYLEKLGFYLVGYGCTACIGNSGPLDPAIDRALATHGVVAASVLSGNRNFEARIHQSVRANFLASPPLVVAFAIAGRVDIDFETEPLGRGEDGDVYLRDVWPTEGEILAALKNSVDPKVYRRLYAKAREESPLWNEIRAPPGRVFPWRPESTYIREPPYFEDFPLEPLGVRDVRGARALAIFGDSVTTDHISPAGTIRTSSPAGAYLLSKGVSAEDFNSYGSRRGNHEVMVRGTFGNVRIRNLMVPGSEGGVTVYQGTGEVLSIYDAAMRYRAEGVPLLVFAGSEYGTGSSRDWAAKGTSLLGVRAVIAQSFERIHRSNLVGMGVLPCEFLEGASARSLGIDGSEAFDLLGLEAEGGRGIEPRSRARLVVKRKDGSEEEVPVLLRLDTPVEVEHYRHGGILPFVLRGILGQGGPGESERTRRGET